MRHLTPPRYESWSTALAGEDQRGVRWRYGAKHNESTEASFHLGQPDTNSACILWCFRLAPIGGALFISLHEWPLLGGEPSFVGLRHFGEILGEERFWNALGNTAGFTAAYVASVLVIGLGLALLLLSMNERVRFIMRPIYFAPQVTSAVAVAIMAAWMFQPHIGIVNSVLKSLGFQGRPLWLNSTELVMPTIIGTAVWRSVGYSMVIFTAGLMNIPPDLYEAAQVDGANKWTSFWRITLPLLKPTTLFVFVTTTISGFQVFIEPWLMSGGGTGHGEPSDHVGDLRPRFPLLQYGQCFGAGRLPVSGHRGDCLAADALFAAGI